MEIGACAAYTAEAAAIKHYFLSPTEKIMLDLELHAYGYRETNR